MDSTTVGQLALAWSAVALIVSAVFGGRPERAGCAVVVVATAVTWVAQGAPGSTPELAFLLIDLAAGVGFGVILLRTRLFWPGIACCAQALLSAFNATRFLNFPLSEQSYIMVLQLSGVLVSTALIYGTWQRRFPNPEPAW